ncbi:hypothetical protein SAMN05660649_04319 [Desulfotomaculum arcticum]|uniref:HTH cro/C1-type domain-containing protein n=1 Tax=Desulfotruncus arcticus DSM 17038 TaxID=1121424 RepID=A0A1I2YA07_9FIRM|nr:hypothetical protein [Desulfotruncus arcticus]SFH22199.1 hypothetical protein SAMN05660649_04319 [Desulfotomaculum arcticum] [Desulfotruncus arcticus DSM 17038]
MFDKQKFAQLLNRARGDRSINQYALHTGVTSAHISRLSRAILDSPPSPQTIKKLADNAYNDVTYKDLMAAAGYLDQKDPPKPKALEGLDMFFLRAVGKLSPEGKKKVYDYVEMVDALEKQKIKEQNKKK